MEGLSRRLPWRGAGGKARERMLQCLFALVIFVLATLYLPKLGRFILFDDEYEYWASSAFFMGQDWSSLTSRLSYFSYGYGLLLVPLRLLGSLLEWEWMTLYQAAVVLNALMLVGGYVISLKLCARYFPQVNWLLRSAACLAAALYSSNLFYAHITLTESTLNFVFWLFLYVMMRCVDAPGAGNHAVFALICVYIYTVHQRALAELLVGVLIIICLRLLGVNRLRHVCVFFGTLYGCLLLHMAVKENLQSWFYLGNPKKTLGEAAMAIFTPRAALLLCAFLWLLLFLHLLDRKKRRLAALVMATGIAAGLAALMLWGGNVQSAGRLATNDFSGQWEKIRNLFSRNGLLRLGISMMGKWFYLASATGLVVCWGMKESIRHVFRAVLDFFGSVRAALTGRGHTHSRIFAEHLREDVWFLGVSLSWMGSFMVNAIYKEGFYKTDDLFNGRYNEFVLGILILYSFFCLLEDKSWLRCFIISLVLYILAGVLCQYWLDKVQRTQFELAHCVMFGRIIWNYEVATGKMWVVFQWILPLTALFFLLAKLGSRHFPKLFMARSLLALLVPIVAWTYLAVRLMDVYVVSINEKQGSSISVIADEIRRLGSGGNIYYLADTVDYCWCETLQFTLLNREITLADSEEISFEEDALYVVGSSFVEEDLLPEGYMVATMSGQCALIIDEDGELAQRWERFHSN